VSSNHWERLAERVRRVIFAASDRLDHLVHITELDPTTDLRFGDWSNLNLAGADLRGYDFTGANLTGSNFQGAMVDGACFNGAKIDDVAGLSRSILEAVARSNRVVVPRGFDEATKVANAQDEFRAELERKNWSGSEIDYYITRFRPSYWLNVDLAAKLNHARFIRRSETEGVPYRVKFDFDIRRDVVVFTTISPDYPSLLAVITGACYSEGANIVDARIHTTRHGAALDTISIARSIPRNEDEVATLVRLANKIERSVRDKFLPNRKSLAGRIETRGALSIKPEVFLDNDASDEFTLLEVTGPDRPGLLYELTRKVFELNLDIAAAEVRTLGERAVDVFWISDVHRGKIDSARHRTSIKRSIMNVFTTGGGR
jgi:[protein-PII] uridylyltransferase